MRKVILEMYVKIAYWMFKSKKLNIKTEKIELLFKDKEKELV